MSENHIPNLRADDLGRFILDVHTPAERTIGRMFGCFTWIAAFMAFALFGAVMGGDFGILSKLARIVGLVIVVAFFYQCRKNIDCYYVLDDVGGQLLYHFSAIMIVSEDPVANLEDVAGIGVSYAGEKASSSVGSWAVFFCMFDGRQIRVSDFFDHPDLANAIASDIAQLVKVPFLTCNYGERKIVVVENGKLTQKIDDSLISSVSKDRATGCFMTLFIIPYAFWPTLAFLILAFMIASGASEERNIEYYREQRDYGYVEIDGTVLPKLERRRGKKSSGNSSRHDSRNKRQFKAEAENLADNQKTSEGFFDFSSEFSSKKLLASGTIIPGVGIKNLVQLDEEMHLVLERFNRPVPEVEIPDRAGFNKKLNKYVGMPRIHENILGGAVSIVFEPDRGKKMRVSRIEIFRGKDLPNKTPSGIGFGASKKKIFNLDDENDQIDYRERSKIQDRFPTVSFFTSHGPEGRQIGIEFKKEGIAYCFSGDRLTEIVITRRWR